MADIKTRDAVKGTIKTIDKAAVASERMKAAYAKTKDKAEQGYYAEESSATEYAADKISHTADRVKDEGIMASIVKRKNRYSVVYTYTDESGAKRQKWETFATNAEAKKRKKQIEFEQDTGTFILPTAKTVSDLLEEYMSIYGVNTWAMSTYEARRSLIFNLDRL